MSKCIKCGNLFINNPPNDEMCHICKISDLETKLAESEEEIKQLVFQINIKDGENAELEKRIYELDGNGFCSGECWCCDYFKDGNDCYSVCTYKADQDKIEFAIEQLEKVKEYIDNHKCKTITDDRYVIYRKSLVNTIDNQINELKGNTNAE